jgi:hypothetical protein
MFVLLVTNEGHGQKMAAMRDPANSHMCGIIGIACDHSMI